MAMSERIESNGSNDGMFSEEQKLYK